MAYEALGKFDSARDETLYSLCLEWQEDYTGESDYGLWSCPISISEDDLSNETLIELAKSVDDEMPLSELLGHFLVQENSQGLVFVAKYADTDNRDADYQAQESAYSEWLESDDDDDD
jgi:hypothetical protein